LPRGIRAGFLILFPSPLPENLKEPSCFFADFDPGDLGPPLFIKKRGENEQKDKSALFAIKNSPIAGTVF
jgi:hypothetical protein